MNDEYSHNNSSIFYIVENIIGPMEQSSEYEQMLNDFNSQLSEHCSCDRDCSLPKCECLRKSFGENFMTVWKNNHKTLRSNMMPSPIFECNKFCLCSVNCNNRVVQNGPIYGLEIKSCDKGLGLFTSTFIPEGSFICEYAGELLTKAQAAVRHQINLKHGKMNYIFCLKEHSDKNVVETFVDPSIFGNIGRYINHSCEPNCHIIPVRCENPLPKLAIFAISDILPYEELSFHYGLDTSGSQSTHRIKCLCRSKTCSGFIPFYTSY